VFRAVTNTEGAVPMADGDTLTLLIDHQQERTRLDQATTTCCATLASFVYYGCFESVFLT